MTFYEELKDPIHLHLIISAALGALIGLERELRGKDPSLRTFSLICLGSCMFGMISKHAAVGYMNADPGRIAAQIVSGIGFLGAGAIFRSKFGVSGLTTAAMMWVTAAIGLCVGLDKVSLAVSGTIVVLFFIVILRHVHSFIGYCRGEEVEHD